MESLLDLSPSEVKASAQISFQIISILLLLIVSVGPIVGPGISVVEPRLPDQPVVNCIEPPQRATSTNPTVIGNVTRDGDTIRINYSKKSNTTNRTRLEIKLPRNGVLVNSNGFNADHIVLGGYPLTWNSSADSHYIQFRMQNTREVSYPSSSTWMYSGVPDHRGADVDLRIKPDGFVGANVLFIGKYTTIQTTEGCQTFTAYLPSTVIPGREFVVRDRLMELRVAARSIPDGVHYSQVRAFVVPQKFKANIGGYNIESENEFLVSTKTSRDASVVWIHEYIHTTQNFKTYPSGSWLVESIANYLAYRIAVENGYISPRTYEGFLLESNAVSWNQTINQAQQTDSIVYQRGAVIHEYSDSKLHNTGNGSIAEFQGEMNTKDRVSGSDYFRYLKRKGVDNETLHRTNDLLYSTDKIPVEYQLEPGWLPTDVRIMLGNLAHPVFRGAASFAIFMFAIGKLWNRFGSE